MAAITAAIKKKSAAQPAKIKKVFEDGTVKARRVATVVRQASRMSFTLTDDGPLSGKLLWKYQPQAARLYKNTVAEVGVAVVIGANFLTSCAESTVDPQKNRYQDIFTKFELMYNIIFTFELMFNMYAFWFWRFWRDGWNVFDFTVVSIGLMTTLNVPLPGPLKLLRMMRAFRVFRLFKRIKCLKKILEALAKAIPGMINALVIQLLVFCIYAMIAVEFWNSFGKDGFFINDEGNTVSVDTARWQRHGAEYYGSFPKAFYTLFQVMSTDSWAEAVARPTINSSNTAIVCGVALYYVSFLILNAIILVNVVVAVLLEKILDMRDDDEDDDWLPEEIVTHVGKQEIDWDRSSLFGETCHTFSDPFQNTRFSASMGVEILKEESTCDPFQNTRFSTSMPAVPRRTSFLEDVQTGVAILKEEIAVLKDDLSFLTDALLKKQVNFKNARSYSCDKSHIANSHVPLYLKNDIVLPPITEHPFLAKNEALKTNPANNVGSDEVLRRTASEGEIDNVRSDEVLRRTASEGEIYNSAALDLD